VNIRDKYAFVGVGLTALGKIPEMTPDELAAQAIRLALADAGMKKEEVDGYIYQPGIGGGPNDTVPLQLTGIPASLVWQVPSLGSYAIVMVSLAIGAMEAGLCHTCLLVHASSAASRRITVGGGGPTERSTPASSSMSSRESDMSGGQHRVGADDLQRHIGLLGSELRAPAALQLGQNMVVRVIGIKTHQNTLCRGRCGTHLLHDIIRYG